MGVGVHRFVEQEHASSKDQEAEQIRKQWTQESDVPFTSWGLQIRILLGLDDRFDKVLKTVAIFPVVIVSLARKKIARKAHILTALFASTKLKGFTPNVLEPKSCRFELEAYRISEIVIVTPGDSVLDEKTIGALGLK